MIKKNLCQKHIFLLKRKAALKSLVHVEIKHVVTSNRGGAYVSAHNLHQALLTKGIKSELFHRGSQVEGKKLPQEYSLPVSQISKINSKCITFLQSNLVQKDDELISTFGVSVVNPKVVFQREDILHIHSFYNLLNTRSISDFILSDVRVILQLHDERFLTGGCHHDLGCNRFLNDCHDCPQIRSIFRKSVAHEKARINSLLMRSNVHVVAPSRFLREKAESLVPASRVHEIPNVPETNNGKRDIYRNEIRGKLKFKDTDFVLGFCAANIDSPYKNFEYFADLVERVTSIWPKSNRNLKILVVGKGGQSRLANSAIRVLGTEAFPAKNYLAAMDLLVVPSKIDNVPNVIVEAQLEGTAIIASKVGGIPDLLVESPSIGYLEKNLDSDSQRIMELVGRIDRLHIANLAKNKFQQEKVLQKYLDLYYSLA